MESRPLSLTEVNKTALDHFVYQPVSREMIAYLAAAAHNVIACEPSSSASSSTDSRTPSPVPSEDNSLPTVEEFITHLVCSSNVQVPTLMSTLVYLRRLKSKLQPMARGLRCTTHRILLASLILSAKYLNDSSPKNKHWANYTHMNTDWYSFGFSRTEVNLMEKQLLFLLEWDLRISEDDLYREFEIFLCPLRDQIVERHARKQRQREEKRRQKQAYQVHYAAQAQVVAAAARYPSPPSSRDASRHPSPEQHARSTSADSISPPSLSYSSSASSYASSTFSSRNHSRAVTPLDGGSSNDIPAAYFYGGDKGDGSLYDSPVQISMDPPEPQVRIVDVSSRSNNMLPYEISANEYQKLHEEAQVAGKKKQRRGMWGRILGGAVAVR